MSGVQPPQSTWGQIGNRCLKWPQRGAGDQLQMQEQKQKETSRTRFCRVKGVCIQMTMWGGRRYLSSILNKKQCQADKDQRKLHSDNMGASPRRYTQDSSSCFARERWIQATMRSYCLTRKTAGIEKTKLQGPRGIWRAAVVCCWPEPCAVAQMGSSIDPLPNFRSEIPHSPIASPLAYAPAQTTIHRTNQRLMEVGAPSAPWLWALSTEQEAKCSWQTEVENMGSEGSGGQHGSWDRDLSLLGTWSGQEAAAQVSSFYPRQFTTIYVSPTESHG